MTARGGNLIGLAFAVVWLWIGATALPMPWTVIAAVLGGGALAACACHVLRRPGRSSAEGGFDWRKFWVAVAFEVLAGNLVVYWLAKNGRLAYLWPAFGIIVALHFIGLWWASHDRRFITLTVAMTAVNVIALFFPAGGTAMLAISGLGSAAALCAAMVRR